MLKMGQESVKLQAKPDGDFWRFLRPVFSAGRAQAQHISDLHSKFALRPHHVWKYGRHPICGG